MSDKLSSIPPNGTTKLGWEDLDNLLQANFKTDTYKDSRVATIDADNYEMSVDEIVAEAENKGYKVEVKPGNHIRFTD